MLLVLLLVGPLAQIGLDAYASALPRLRSEFNTSGHYAQNTMTAYMLGMTVAALPAGLIADAVGRKRVLLGGLATMVTATVGCAAAPGLATLLTFRFAAGVAAGAVVVMISPIAADCFGGARLVSVLGIVGAVCGSAGVIGQAVGGFVVEYLSWRWVFVFVALTAAVALAVVAVAFEETLDERLRSAVDLPASVTVVVAALRQPVFIAVLVTFGVIGAGSVVFGVVAPFLYQDELGFSAATYGVTAMIVAAAGFAGQFTCGALARRLGVPRLAMVLWVVLTAGGIVLLASASLIGADALATTSGAGLVALAIGGLMPLTKGMAMSLFSRNLGLIAGLVNTFFYLTSSGAMALMAFLPAEQSQAPLGWFYVAAAAMLGALLWPVLRSRRVTSKGRG